MKLELYFKTKNHCVIDHVNSYFIDHELETFSVQYSTPYEDKSFYWELSEIQIGYIDEEWVVGDGEPYDAQELEYTIERVVCETFGLPCCKDYFKSYNDICGMFCEKKQGE